MAVNFVQVPPASTGLKIDTSELTINGVVVERQNVCIADSGKNTYCGTSASFSAGTGATTDIFTLYGAAGKLVRPLRLYFSSTSTTAAQYFDVLLSKRSTASSGAAGTTITGTPIDSGMPAASAVCKNFATTAPTAGTNAGDMILQRVFSPLLGTPALTPPTLIWDFGQGQVPSIVLRSATEGIALTLSGITPANATQIDISVIWTEEVA